MAGRLSDRAATGPVGEPTRSVQLAPVGGPAGLPWPWTWKLTRLTSLRLMCGNISQAPSVAMLYRLLAVTVPYWPWFWVAV